ncbi:MAG: carbohydrate ABC transporter permease [Treponema sp.]|jgi:ABC-type glycerol-3-phosphate transport system permease component|nr:carbohydrate ABC transporter permease [Treponema sp.]
MVERKTVGSTFVKVLLVVILTISALSCLLPLVYNLAVSLSSKAAAEAGRVSFWPVGFTTNAYKEIMKEKNFFISFWVTVKRVLLAVLVTLTVLTLAAYPLAKSRLEFAPRNVILWIFIFCMLFSGGTIPWYMVMKNYGLINNVFGLAICGGIPVFYLILMVNFFQGIPKELEEAAMIDGAGPWYILLRVVVPLSKPVIATIALFTIVGHWNEFFQGLVLSTSADHYPLQTYINQLVFQMDTSQMTAEQIRQMSMMSNTTLNAAKIFISMVPILCIYPFLQKYFVTGITLGGVKE